MKINDNEYFCPWCELTFKQSIRKTTGNGRKGRATDQCICINCAACISQKTKFEMDKKLGVSE